MEQKSTCYPEMQLACDMMLQLGVTLFLPQFAIKNVCNRCMHDSHAMEIKKKKESSIKYKVIGVLNRMETWIATCKVDTSIF